MESDPGSGSVPSADLSQQLQRAARTIEQIRVQLHFRLRSEYWFGERADTVRGLWDSTVGPALDQTTGLLRTMLGEVPQEVLDTTSDHELVDDTDGA